MNIRRGAKMQMGDGAEDLVSAGQMSCVSQFHINRNKGVVGQKPKTLAIDLTLDNHICGHRNDLNPPSKDIGHLGIVLGKLFYRRGIFLKIRSWLGGFCQSQLQRFYCHQAVTDFRQDSCGGKSRHCSLAAFFQKVPAFLRRSGEMVNENIGVNEDFLVVFYLSQFHRYFPAGLPLMRRAALLKFQSWLLPWRMARTKIPCVLDIRKEPFPGDGLWWCDGAGRRSWPAITACRLICLRTFFACLPPFRNNHNMRIFYYQDIFQDFKNLSREGQNA